jgi:homotetrameric NADPH-dependent glutamate synthase
MYRIARTRKFSALSFLWEIEAPDVAAAAEPGHFVMLRLHEDGERIPLTVADFDRRRGTVTVVVQALGKTTCAMRDQYAEGDELLDFVGPLGLPQHIGQHGHVVLVGGGLGVAPVFPQLRAFKQAGNRTTCVVGFRDASRRFWLDKLSDWADELIVCTDDGSAGRAGFVDAALTEVLRGDPADLVVAIGPMPMMRACAEASRPFGVRTRVSLNTIMVDGTGMCGSCRVTVGGKVKFACVDGPDFDAHQIDFDELMARQKRFRRQEQQASADHAHVCSLEDLLLRQGKRTYKKYAAVEKHQVAMPERDAQQRSGCFDEVNLGYTQGDALREAERCIQCVKPTCIEGCPVRIDIPRFIRHLLVRDLPAALAAIHESSPFPSICGRVCPQESQCEAQCVLIKARREPVAIGRLERFVGDHAPAPQPPRMGVHGWAASGRVAVVGSGPGGLAAAADLAKADYEVTVFEALHVVGGVLRYGIPSFRLPRAIVERELQQLRDAGVRFETNKVIGKTFGVQQLLDRMGYDAVFVAAGAGAPLFLGIPGESAGQVYSANEFLTRVNLMGGDRFPYRDTPVGLGQRVMVIGAGNTAMDCLRTARRLGATEVRCVYRRSEAEAPARVEELRHAREEGVQFSFLHAPVAVLLNEQGDVHALRARKMMLGDPDARGRRQPVPLDEVVEWSCDSVIYALGTLANPIVGRSTPGLALDARGFVAADADTQATSLRGVFAGGDIVTGGATVILAMAAGRRAARAIDHWLQGDRSAWPPTVPAPAAAEATAADARTPH